MHIIPHMTYPLTMFELRQAIVRETAKVSYPGRMAGGIRPIVKQGTKESIEKYLVSVFPNNPIWLDLAAVDANYDEWHTKECLHLAEHLVQGQFLDNPGNSPSVVASKFINTFMHQLMKYEQFRPLWMKLHLPLDSQVLSGFNNLRRALPRSVALGNINRIARQKSAYSISFEEYTYVQENLWGVVSDLNLRPGAEFRVTSRIELNYLWSGV